jgi:hypothetical protein
MRKSLSFLLILLILSGCATTSNSVREFSILKKEPLIKVDDLSTYDMAYLDKSHYFVQIESAVTKEKAQKRVGMIFTTETLKQQKISLNSINLKSWISKSLKNQGYFIERISSSSQVVILVEYGMEEYPSVKYQQNFKGKLYNRYLNLRALNYPAFKKQKQQKVLWELRVSSIGPDTEIGKILPILGAFVGEGLGKTLEDKFFISNNDPRLDSTKEIPTAISVEEFKPTVEELKFFN